MLNEPPISVSLVSQRRAGGPVLASAFLWGGLFVTMCSITLGGPALLYSYPVLVTLLGSHIRSGLLDLPDYEVSALYKHSETPLTHLF